MFLIKGNKISSKACFQGLLACVLAAGLAGSLLSAPALAYAEVRKADVVFGESVEARGLSVAQCPDIEADYAIVMDADGTVFFERDATAPTPIASITKIMTGIVALDLIDRGEVTLETPITVSAAAAYVGESSAGLIEGDTMSLETALKALLVPSGNDAAVAIAETLGSLAITQAQEKGEVITKADGAPATPEDAEEVYVGLMNTKASELGCIDTLFENPHGLDDGDFKGNLHSCAADVAKMSQYAMKNELFRSIVGAGDTSIVVNRADGTRATIALVSTDELIGVYPYAIGIKTGFTNAAGNSFAGAANNLERELYSVVIHASSSEQRFADSVELFDWVYEHAIDYKLANSAQNTEMALNGKNTQVPVVAEVAHVDWMDKTVKATMEDPSASVNIFDLNGNVSQSLSFDEVKGNVRVGDKVGSITFKQRNEVIAEMNLIACENVNTPDFFEGVGIWWDRLFKGFSGQPQVAESITLNETPLVIDKTLAAAA